MWTLRFNDLQPNRWEVLTCCRQKINRTMFWLFKRFRHIVCVWVFILYRNTPKWDRNWMSLHRPNIGRNILRTYQMSGIVEIHTDKEYGFSRSSEPHNLLDWQSLDLFTQHVSLCFFFFLFRLFHFQQLPVCSIFYFWFTVSTHIHFTKTESTKW